MSSKINPDLDVRTLLNEGMGIKLHWFPETVNPPVLAQILVGMANTKGGQVILGIAPRSPKILGVKDIQQVFDKIFKAALLADPSLVLPMPQVQTFDNLQLVIVTIPEGLPAVYSFEGRYLGREGSQTNPLPPRWLRQLLVERGVIQFETHVPPSASLGDLDKNKVEDYIQKLGYSAGESMEEVLFRRGCIRNESAKRKDFRPTYAGLLMFGRDPQQWLPSANILAARFSGESMVDRFIKQDINGTLPDQLRQAEAFVHQNMRKIVRIVGLTREENPEYPLEAVRELIVNAIAHRDYNLQGDNIHINLYSDRIEVHSPGGLPGPVNLDNLLTARFSRNPIIVQALSDLGFVERLGYGLDRVVRVIRQYSLPPPHFEEIAGSFRVTLYGESAEILRAPEFDAFREMPLNLRQQVALKYLVKKRRITSGEYQELCPDVHPETLRRDLANLVSLGVLIKVGDKKATYYILK